MASRYLFATPRLERRTSRRTSSSLSPPLLLLVQPTLLYLVLLLSAPSSGDEFEKTLLYHHNISHRLLHFEGLTADGKPYHDDYYLHVEIADQMSETVPPDHVTHGPFVMHGWRAEAFSKSQSRTTKAVPNQERMVAEGQPTQTGNTAETNHHQLTEEKGADGRIVQQNNTAKRAVVSSPSEALNTSNTISLDADDRETIQATDVLSQLVKEKNLLIIMLGSALAVTLLTATGVWVYRTGIPVLRRRKDGMKPMEEDEERSISHEASSESITMSAGNLKSSASHLPGLWRRSVPDIFSWWTTNHNRSSKKINFPLDSFIATPSYS